MREIKFRAWDDKNKRFWIEDALYGLGTYWNICPNGFVDATENNMCREPEDFVLQQFTGLKDKNGKEIYEGDIVQTNYKEETIIQEVIFRDGAWMPFYWQRTHGLDYQETNLIKFLKFEVIGNKFENPELLE